MSVNLQQQLKDIKPTKEFFVGIDSDGCVFDTMEIKHKECFCPNFIKYFDLQNVSKYARETWDFVNLYSKTRGCNRFLAVIESLKLLSERKEVLARGVKIPDYSELVNWTKVETMLGNPALEKLVKENNSPFMKKVLEWSKKVNADIADMVYGISPFPFLVDSLKKITEKADMIVVSQTPYEALQREWEENKIEHFARFIAGQEAGTKKEHLALAAGGKYPADKILMIGDAPGDFKAAQGNNALFFPINPGHEEASWEKLYKEGLDKFFNGSFKGDYQQKLIAEFESYLPEKPSWK